MSPENMMVIVVMAIVVMVIIVIVIIVMAIVVMVAIVAATIQPPVRLLNIIRFCRLGEQPELAILT